MTPQTHAPFNESWRRRKSAAFDLAQNSTAGRLIQASIFGREVSVYANANVSIYSRQSCNAACAFCVENLRPASRGVELEKQKYIQRDHGRYFGALEKVLTELKPLNLTYSVTGGEPSMDPKLPEIIGSLAAHRPRKLTLTTNGSGLLQARSGKRVIDWICAGDFHHLNISVASADYARNAELMRLRDGLTHTQLTQVVQLASAAGCRVRLSCVLLKSETRSLDAIVRYITFARSLGVNNVIFRQLMKTDSTTHSANSVVRYSHKERVALEPLLDQMSADSRFQFQRQIVGYYYYVEVWRCEGLDVVFEEADLGQLEIEKRRHPHIIHELVYHPSGQLASTWQPWDGVLGPAAEGV